VLGIQFLGKRASPKTASARNPAFDVTPHRLISGIITENGVVYPPYETNLREAVMADKS
jgi:methylthioribose-1-phosphate isomerase